MAPVFSRDAWRCVWHMIQVWTNILYFSSLSLACCTILKLPYFENCRMTWSMGGVLTLPWENVYTWVTCLLFFFYFPFSSLIINSWSDCICKFLLNNILLFLKTACTWEDWSCRFAVDCSSRCSLTWESGKRRNHRQCLYSHFYEAFWNEKLICFFISLFF